MKVCPKCDEQHQMPGKFCSRKCANSRVFTDASNEKRSRSNRNAVLNMDIEMRLRRNKQLRESSPNFRDGPYTKIKLKKCSGCGVEFWSNNANTKTLNSTCSDNCFLTVKRRNSSGKKIEYNGTVYDSNWEVIIAKWFDDEGILYERPLNFVRWVDKLGKNRKYFPDFYLPALNLYVDPKNKFCIISQSDKLNYVSKHIDLIYGDIDLIKQTVTARFL